MTMEDRVQQVIKTYLSSQLLVEFNGGIDGDTDLFQRGLLDSYSYIELIRFLEQEFGLRFSNDEMLSNIEVSLNGIVDLVNHKS
jgi:acyl carrier protein